MLAAKPAEQAMEAEVELEVPERHALDQPQSDSVAHRAIQSTIPLI